MAVTVGALCVVAVLALLVGRSLAARSAPESQGQPSAASVSGQPGTDLSSAGALSLGACIDPTLSLIPSFAPAIRSDLSQPLASLAAQSQLVTDAAMAGQPSVNLTVRQVDTYSFSTTMSAFTRNVQVPGIHGLTVARPAPGSAGYVGRLRVWSQGYQTVSDDRKATTGAAAGASGTIGSLPLDQNAASWSGISACVSALLLTVPPAGNHSYLLASDLEENVTPQLAGSFHGAPLFIVQACDNGSASYCQGLLDHFKQEMQRLDVGQVTVIRPEDAAQAISQWVHAGAATP
jgi:hypothetical protein